MPQKVRDVMTYPAITVSADTPLSDVAKTMRDAGVGTVIVTRDFDTIGIVSDRDIVVRALAADGSAGFQPADDVCSSDVVSVEPDTDADDAVDLMRRHAIRRLPVIEDGRPVGILSIGDMAVERDRDSALGDISAAPPNT